MTLKTVPAMIFSKSDTTQTTMAVGWQEFFINKNNDPSPNGCKVTGCSMWKAGQCGTGALPSAVTSILVMGTSDPWAITTSSYLPDGWS
jgi:hypothetical protein